MLIRSTFFSSVFTIAGCMATNSSTVKDAGGAVGAGGAGGAGKQLSCEFHYRASTSASFSQQENKSCVLSDGQGAAALPDSFSLGGLDFRFGCDSGFFVGADLSGNQHHQILHQNVPPKISDATGNSHGFTGLNYVYSPSGSEVQYWCAKNGSKIDCQFHHRTLPSGANQSTKDYSCQTSNSPGAQVPDEFTLGDIDFRVGCGQGIFIGADRNGEQLHQVTHQDIENGTHGVTGLNYVYSPAGEEVQYWCSLK